MPPAEEIMNPELITYRLDAIERAINSVSDSMQKLVVLEQKHIETRESIDRAFKMLHTIDKRVVAVESEIPTLKLVRGWVITGTIGILSLVGIAVFQIILKHGAGV